MTFARRKAWSAGQTRNWGGTQDRLTPAELVAGLKQHSTHGEGELSGRSTNQHHDQLTTNCKLHSNGANGKSCTRIFGFHEFSCICLRKWWALQVKIPHEYCCIVVSFYRKRYSKNWGLTYISVKMQEFKIGVITLLMPPRYIFLPEPLLSERKEKTRLSKATINTSLSTILENVDLQSKKKVFSRITGKMVLKKHWKSAPEKRVNYSKNLLNIVFRIALTCFSALCKAELA